MNILAEDQEDVCRVFASKAADKFAEIGWKHIGQRLTAASRACWPTSTATSTTVVPSGDHDVVIGAVRDLEVLHEGGPLLFFRGGYGRFQL